MFCFVGKKLTIEQLWKKVCSLIKEGHLPYCNAKLQVFNNYFTICTHALFLLVNFLTVTSQIFNVAFSGTPRRSVGLL